MALTVAQLVARLTADTSGFYRGMALANSSMIRTGGIITRVAAGAGLAVAGMGILSVRSAGNFEQSMNIVQAVSGATNEQFKQMSSLAIALGKDMKLPNVSAKDAAESMTELSKAGLSVNDVMNATRGTLQLGIAANIGYADSATITARALTAFGLSGGQATKVADLLTAAANKSTADITDLALGMQMASAQFKAGDQTIQGLTTSLALMANAGIAGSDAGTSLKTMMNRLMAPTKKAKDLMGELGFKVYDANGNMKPMPRIIDSLSGALKGMSKEQRNATLYTLFGSDAIRAARVLLDAGSEGYRKMEKSITAGGEAQKFAEARTKGFNGALGALSSAVETVAITLGMAMLPALTSAARALATWVNNLDTARIIGFFTAIKDGVAWIYNLISGSDALQMTLAGLAAAFVAFRVVSTIIAIFRALQIAALGLNAALLANPIGLIVAAIIGLGVAAVVAYQKFEAFRNVVDGVFGWLKSNVVPIITGIVEALRRNWDQIKSDAQAALQLVVAYVKAIWGPLVGVIRSNWDNILGVLKAVWNNIVILVRTQLQMVKGAIDLIMGIIRGDWGRAWDGLKTMVSAVFNGIRALITNTLGNLVPAVLRLALGIGKALITGITQGLVTLSATVLGKIKEGISSAVSSAAGWVVGVAASIGRGIVDGILSGVTGLGGALADKLKGMIGGALSAAKSAFGIFSPSKATEEEIGKPLGQGIISGFLLGTADLPTKISDTVKAALERGKAVVENYRGQYSAAFGNLANDALTAFDAVSSAHMTKSEKILDRLVSNRDKEEFKRRMAEARTAVTDAQAALAAFNADPAAAGDAAAQAEKRKQLEADVLASERAVQDLQFEQKRAHLEKLALQEDLNYQARRALQRRHLAEELTQLEQNLIKHPEKHRFYQNKIVALLNSYGVTYKGAGRSLGAAFAEGLEESIGRIEAAAGRMAAAVAKYLKLKSPAETGPLSDLDRWWAPFASTLVSGLDTSPISRAASAMAGGVHPGIGTGLSSTGSLASVGAGAAGNVTVYHVQGSLISERELDERIREGVIEQSRVGRTTP